MAPPSPSAPDSPPDQPDTPASPSASGNMSRVFSLPQTVGLLFLVAQAIFVLQMWLTKDSPRLLTPVEGVTRYDLAATMDAHALDPGMVRDRYGLSSSGMVCLTASAVQGIVATVERPIPLERAMFVRLRTRNPGGVEEFWLWPQE